MAVDRDVDEIPVGATSGDPDRVREPPGTAVRVVLAGADRPVTVLPGVAPQ